MSVLNVPQPAFMEEEEIAIFADAVERVNSGAAKTSAVCTWTRGNASATQYAGSVTGVSRSPMPRAIAWLRRSQKPYWLR